MTLFFVFLSLSRLGFFSEGSTEGRRGVREEKGREEGKRRKEG